MVSEPREVWGDLATTAFVESSLLFKTLDDEARRDLLQIARVVAYAPGERISGQGDESFLLVRDGSAVLVASGAAGPVEVAALERGAFFGEAGVLGGGRPVALVARGDVVAVSVPGSMIAALAERFPRMKRLLEAVLVAREKDAAAKLAS